MPTCTSKPIERVYVVYKRSVYQKYVLDLGNSTLSKLIKQKHPSTKTLFYTYDQHRKSLQLIRDVLNHYKIKYNISSRSISKNFSGYDLVITVGGDGTFLRTSHYIDDQLMLGINSVPKFSVGAWCSITYKDFAKKFRDILAGKLRVRSYHRMTLTLNGHTLPIEPVNDVLFC
ncbi:MAG TPA: NAD(+)/NADH kinase, partial [bacterium]|nr:NAD(+)/NADH kinase [bacterium]